MKIKEKDCVKLDLWAEFDRLCGEQNMNQCIMYSKLNKSDLGVDSVDSTRSLLANEVKECVTVLIGIAYKAYAIADIIDRLFGKDEELYVGIVGIGLLIHCKTNGT